MIIYNEKDKAVRDKAVQALRHREEANEKTKIEYFHKCFLILKQKFPDLELDIDNFGFNIAGYKFNSSYNSYSYTENGNINPELIPILQWTMHNRRVYDMASLGEYILYRERCDNPPKATA